MWQRAPPDLKSRKHFICRQKTVSEWGRVVQVCVFFCVNDRDKRETYWQLGEWRVADMSTEHLLLELEQLDHQTGQRLVGGGLSLDVLRRGQQHREAVRGEPQRGNII